jgi:hypothetical protein
MNDESQHGREQLEAATSRSLRTNAALDAETSALRDGFMALGRAVEAAATDYDEAALIARVQSACRHEAAIELPNRNASRLWPLVLSGALAAAALVAAVRIAVTWPADTSVVVTQPAPAAAGDSHVDPLTPTDDSAVAGSWHDPLDEEIAAAQSSLARLGASPGGIDGTLSNMNQTLEAMSDELIGESL